jgi:FeS assembly SUF system protein
MMEYSPFADFTTTVPLADDGKAYAGAPLEAGVAIAAEPALIEAMKTVYDPEIPVDIYELGLIYKIDIAANGAVAVDMTLTAPGCPVAGILPGQVAEAAAKVDGVGEVTVEIVWDPPWDMSRMSEAARVELDMF